MSEKAVDACLPGLKFIPVWFVAPKMLEDLDNAVLFNNDIDPDNDVLGNVTFLMIIMTTLHSVMSL